MKYRRISRDLLIIYCAPFSVHMGNVATYLYYKGEVIKYFQKEDRLQPYWKKVRKLVGEVEENDYLHLVKSKL